MLYHGDVTSCYVMWHYVMLCYVMLCYVMLCYVMLCYVMLCYVVLVLCCVVLCCVALRCVVLCCVNVFLFTCLLLYWFFLFVCWFFEFSDIRLFDYCFHGFLSFYNSYWQTWQLNWRKRGKTFLTSNLWLVIKLYRLILPFSSFSFLLRLFLSSLFTGFRYTPTTQNLSFMWIVYS